MQTAEQIRQALAQVAQLRQQQAGDASLAQAVAQIKRIQSARFAHSYADIMHSGPAAAAARFFLLELYGERDYRQRDAQFARIAGTVQRVFPQAVATTALALATIHALTENLDHQLAQQWLTTSTEQSTGLRYLRAWRALGQREARQRQVDDVMVLGADLARLTRIPGLRTLLRLMRGPAAAADMSALQDFLERGFDTFATLARADPGAARFLRLVRERECAVIQSWFDDALEVCASQLDQVLVCAPRIGE